MDFGICLYYSAISVCICAVSVYHSKLALFEGFLSDQTELKARDLLHGVESVRSGPLHNDHSTFQGFDDSIHLEFVNC